MTPSCDDMFLTIVIPVRCSSHACLVSCVVFPFFSFPLLVLVLLLLRGVLLPQDHAPRKGRHPCCSSVVRRSVLCHARHGSDSRVGGRARQVAVTHATKGLDIAVADAHCSGPVGLDSVKRSQFPSFLVGAATELCRVTSRMRVCARQTCMPLLFVQREPRTHHDVVVQHGTPTPHTRSSRGIML